MNVAITNLGLTGALPLTETALGAAEVELADAAVPQATFLASGPDEVSKLTALQGVTPPWELPTSRVIDAGEEASRAKRLAEISSLFRNGIHTEAGDQRFWKLGVEISPTMAAMEEIFEKAPRSLKIFYPRQSESSYTSRSGTALLERERCWADEMVMRSGMHPLVSAHERTHAIPWRLLIQSDSESLPLLPDIAYPKLDPEKDIADIAITLLQQMFLDEALAVLSEVMIAHDFILAGVDPKNIPDYVLEAKRVFDAGGLQAYLDSRIYLGDNHKLIYPAAVAFDLARRIKGGEKIGGISIRDLQGINPATISPEILSAFVQKKFGMDATQVGDWIARFIDREPLKFVGDETKFDTEQEEMRNGALVLGAVLERFAPLLEKTEDPAVLRSLVVKNRELLAKFSGERLSQIMGILIRQAELLHDKRRQEEKEREESHRLLVDVYETASQLFAAKGYLHSARELRNRLIRRDATAYFEVVMDEVYGGAEKLLGKWEGKAADDINKENFFEEIEGWINSVEGTVADIPEEERRENAERFQMESSFTFLIRRLLNIYLQHFSEDAKTERESRLLGKLFLVEDFFSPTLAEDFALKRYPSDMEASFSPETIALVLKNDCLPVPSELLEYLSKVLKATAEMREESSVGLLLNFLSCLPLTPEEKEALDKIGGPVTFYHVPSGEEKEPAGTISAPSEPAKKTEAPDFLRERYEAELRAADDSYDFGQPMWTTMEAAITKARQFAREGLPELALEAYSLASLYFTDGKEKNLELFEQVILNVHKLPLSSETKDEFFAELIETEVPLFDEHSRWGEWQRRMEIVEKLGPTVLAKEYPRARAVLLERLATYTHQRDQRFELLPVALYQRVLTALVEPLADLHPELLEPGFFDRFTLLASGKEDRADPSYHRALAALFPLQTKRIDSDEELENWDPSLIEMGAMDPDGVERKLVEEISQNIRNPDYSKERAEKLGAVLNTFIRFRLNGYIRDVEQKPTDVSYCAADLQEIPILGFLYYATSKREAKEAYTLAEADSIVEGINLGPTGLWDYLEPDEEGYALSPVQAAIFKALLSSQNRSESLAKISIYHELMTQDSLEVGFKRLIVEGLVQGGLLSPHLQKYYRLVKENEADLNMFVEDISLFMAINDNQIPSDFTFSTLLRAKKNGREKEFWARYRRMVAGFKRADGVLPDLIEGKKGGFWSSFRDMNALDFKFFRNKNNQLDLTDEIDLRLLPEFLSHYWGLQTPYPDKSWSFEVLLGGLLNEDHLKGKTKDSNLEEQTKRKMIQIAWVYKILFNIDKFYESHVPWLGVDRLRNRLNLEGQEKYRAKIRAAEADFYEIREEIFGSLSGEMPPVLEAMPPLARFFLAEAWIDLDPVEREKRKKTIEKATEKGESAPEVILAYLEAEGLEKVGQVLHMLHGVVPAEYREALGKTLQANQPATFFEVKQVVEEALEEGLENIYSEFSKEPVGVGSVAQVHQAVRKDNGKRVALKVILPSRVAKVKKGMERLKKVTAWYALQAFRFEVPIDIPAFQRWFEESMKPELDLELEGKNMEVYRKGLEKLRCPAKTPRLSPDHTRKNILEMEWIENGKQLKKSEADAVAEAVLGNLFSEGLVHDDPHPGNVRGATLVDFGRMEKVSEELKVHAAMFFGMLWMAHRYPESSEGLLEVFEKLANLGKEKVGNQPEDKEKLKAYLASDAFRGHVLDGELLAEVIAEGARAGWTLSPQVYVVMKTLMALESLGKSASPDFSLKDLLQNAILPLFWSKRDSGE